MTILSFHLVDKKVYTFSKGISTKVNVTAQLELEFTYYRAAVKHFNHYATVIPYSSIHIQY